MTARLVMLKRPAHTNFLAPEAALDNMRNESFMVEHGARFWHGPRMMSLHMGGFFGYASPITARPGLSGYLATPATCGALARLQRLRHNPPQPAKLMVYHE